MESPQFEKIEFSEEAEELRRKRRPLIHNRAAFNEMGLFALRLQEEHSIEELHDYEAYCVLVGSTPLKKPERFDLEGNDSIVAFIDMLVEKVEHGEEK